MNLGYREDDSYSDDVDDNVLIETAMVIVMATSYLCEFSVGESTASLQ